METYAIFRSYESGLSKAARTETPIMGLLVRYARWKRMAVDAPDEGARAGGQGSLLPKRWRSICPSPTPCPSASDQVACDGLGLRPPGIYQRPRPPA